MEKLTQSNYVDLAENVINQLERDRRGNIGLTTSKIRNLLSLVNGLYNEVKSLRSDDLSEDVKGKIQYIRLRFAYEAGRERSRERSVKDFVKKSDAISHVKNIKDRQDVLLFCKYMEALVAYHKFYGGRD